MSLYTPAAFRSGDVALLDHLVANAPFATLVTVVDGAPLVSHVPVLVNRTDTEIEIAGHLARPNPQAGRGSVGLAILHGPSAYVSPSWYPDKASAARVPTWNYVVAHLAGPVDWFQDEAGLAAHLDALSSRHEAAAGGDWRLDMANEAERVQLRGIIGFRIRAERVDLKAKLSQNHPIPNRRAVRHRLAAADASEARAVAALMAATEPTDS